MSESAGNHGALLGEEPDAELVRRFLAAETPAERQDVFSVIYRRYESVVLGICAQNLR